MKKLYSKKLGGEAFALDAAQLDTLKKAGYTVPSPEEVIADAAAVKIEPPEGKRAYVVFDFKTGAFKDKNESGIMTSSMPYPSSTRKHTQPSSPTCSKRNLVRLTTKMSRFDAPNYFVSPRPEGSKPN